MFPSEELIPSASGETLLNVTLLTVCYLYIGMQSMQLIGSKLKL